MRLTGSPASSKLDWANLAAASMAALALAAAAPADSVRGIHSKTAQPLAPRGSILMLPLGAERPGDHWPATLELKGANGMIITGQVAWVDSTPQKFLRQWTDDPRDLAIRPIQPSDDSSAIDADGAIGPYLLAPLPANANGELRLERQALQPVWQNVPLGDPLKPEQPRNESLDTRETLELAPSPDRPDPVSPFEYWRWVMLADVHDLKPPSPFGGDIERMAARHYADAWRIGMARLARKSLPIASDCRDLLTRTSIDRRQPFAAWVADPAQVGSLLSALINFQRSDADALSDAVSWLDSQLQVFLWPESEGFDRVKLAIVSLRAEPMAAKFTWLNARESATTAEVEPGVLVRITVDRPSPPKSPGPGLPAPPEQRHVLQVEVGGRAHQFAFGPRVAVAKPPGVFFRPLSPPLTLAEAQTGLQRLSQNNETTLVQIRRLSGRWEVFFECRRPPSVQPAAAAEQNVLEKVRTYDDLRGIEAATLVLGPEDSDALGPAIWISVPEQGFPRVIRGSHDGTLQLHKKSYGDRWYCRIVLPESWFSDEAAGPALFGCLRSHADNSQLETGPNITVPWRAAPSRAAVDLKQWDDLPKAP